MSQFVDSRAVRLSSGPRTVRHGERPLSSKAITRLMVTALLLFWPATSWAARVTVGGHRLLPNAPGQEIEIIVRGGETVSGIDLFVQVGDGGPGLARFDLPPGQPGPQIAKVDLLEGTIFAGLNEQPVNLSSPLLPQVSLYTLALLGSTPSVPADGVLARLTMDTTGFFEGTWPLQLTNVLPFPVFGGPYTTNFAGVAADSIQNGSVTIDIGLCDTNGDGRCDPLGDFNSDNRLDAKDIDALSAAIRRGTTSLVLDVNFDNKVDRTDRRVWVEQLRNTYFGDANLDGEFGTGDLVRVFQAGQYEDGEPLNSGWAEGDWNGDGDFGTSDLVLVFQQGAFEQGPRAAMHSAAPEPSAVVLLVRALGILSCRRQLGERGQVGKARRDHAPWRSRSVP